MAKEKKAKKEKVSQEPQYFSSLAAADLPAYNYNVYHMSSSEKILYFCLAFVAGAIVSYLFYGGIGRDEFGNRTTLTWILDISIPVVVGTASGLLFVPVRRKNLVAAKKRELSKQFRDMLDALTTAIGAGNNVTDAFISVYGDMKIQYEDSSFIIRELEIINTGIRQNVKVEDLLEDFGIRSANADILSFANVFRICYRKGGNIKDVIRNTHIILSEKMDIAADIETQLTSNKLEQNIMLVMPIVLVGMIKLMSPEFSANFTTPSGLLSTTVSLVVFVVAYFIGKSVMEIKI